MNVKKYSPKPTKNSTEKQINNPTKNQAKPSRKPRFAHLNMLANVVLGALTFSVGALSIAPVPVAETEAETFEIYRSAPTETEGVSLMFNVYWGTDEVYRILDILKEREAKATFFIGGCWADDNVECLRAIYDAGHEIGNHGYFHKDHAKLSLTDNQKEITSCNQFIELALGIKIDLFAHPSGAYGDNTLQACKQLNVKTILWSRDTIDWRDKDEKLIYKRATKNIKGGEFVLMHPMEATANALDDILAYYETQNLSAISVGENLKSGQKG